MYWFKNWSTLSIKHEISCFVGSDNWERNIDCLLLHMKYDRIREWEDMARKSEHYPLHASLEHPPTNKYIINRSTERELRKIKLILTVRCEALQLNYKFWKKDDILCPLCNLGCHEDMYHFLCVCPIFSNYMRKYFNEPEISSSKMLAYLNGDIWETLYPFVRDIWAYRDTIIKEYTWLWCSYFLSLLWNVVLFYYVIFIIYYFKLLPSICILF